MKRIATLSFVACMLCGCRDLITDDLPMQATFFIRNNFELADPVKVETKDSSEGERIYCVTLDTGAYIVFDKEGFWESVECFDCYFPMAIIPPEITAELNVAYFDFLKYQAVYRRFKAKTDYRIRLYNYSDKSTHTWLYRWSDDVGGYRGMGMEL